MKKTIAAAALLISLVAVGCNNNSATPAPTEPAAEAVESLAAEASVAAEAVESAVAEEVEAVESAVAEASPAT